MNRLDDEVAVSDRAERRAARSESDIGNADAETVDDAESDAEEDELATGTTRLSETAPAAIAAMAGRRGGCSSAAGWLDEVGAMVAEEDDEDAWEVIADALAITLSKLIS
jgi:hypothetical protein